MRPLPGACLAALGAAAAVTVVAAPASAGTSSVEASNWYYDDPGSSTTAATSTSTPTTVPAGDLGVGYRRGTPAPAGAPVGVPYDEADKIAALAFDLSGAPAGSHVTSFTFSLPVDTARDSSSQALVAGQPPAVVACLATRSFTPAPGPSAYLSAPSYDCGTEATGKFDAATTAYDFTATSIAQAWVDGTNTGLVVVPDPKATTPFTLSFTTKVTASLAATAPATPATPATSAAPAGTPAAAATVAPRTTGSGTSAPASAGPAPVQSPPATAGSVEAAPPVTGSLAVATPAAGAAPTVPPPAVATAQPTPAAAQVESTAAVLGPASAAAPLHVTSGFGWLAWLVVALVLVGGLGAVSLGLAGPSEVAASSASRLTRLLDQHRP